MRFGLLLAFAAALFAQDQTEQKPDDPLSLDPVSGQIRAWRGVSQHG